MSTRPVITDREVDKLLDVFNGNARDSIKALMHDLAILLDQGNKSGSRGFGRRDHRLSVVGTRGRTDPRTLTTQPKRHFA